MPLFPEAELRLQHLIHAVGFALWTSWALLQNPVKVAAIPATYVFSPPPQPSMNMLRWCPVNSRLLFFILYWYFDFSESFHLGFSVEINIKLKLKIFYSMKWSKCSFALHFQTNFFFHIIICSKFSSRFHQVKHVHFALECPFISNRKMLNFHLQHLKITCQTKKKHKLICWWPCDLN